MRTILIAIVPALMAAPLWAFTAANLLTVNPLPKNGTFEVVGIASSGPRDFWCAAGQFATMQLGLGANDRIYILKGFAPSETSSRANAVAFTVSEMPEDVATPKYNISMKNKGFSLHTALATSFCSDYIEDLF